MFHVFLFIMPEELCHSDAAKLSLTELLPQQGRQGLKSLKDYKEVNVNLRTCEVSSLHYNLKVQLSFCILFLFHFCPAK